MKNDIEKQLLNIEQKYDVDILYACESGSRAWGFASDDSDYDVRFIYRHKPEWYLSIDELRDVIELPVNDVLDISGWDIKKSLKLFRSSNPPLYEWLHSPIIYRVNNKFLHLIQSRKSEYYSQRAGMHHYISMAHNTYTQHLNNKEVSLKKYFYALRPLCAAIWIYTKRGIPPMEFGTLRTVITNKNVQSEIDHLLIKKAQSTEKETVAPVKSLNEYISVEVAKLQDCVKKTDKSYTDTEELNKIFRKIINDI